MLDRQTRFLMFVRLDQRVPTNFAFLLGCGRMDRPLLEATVTTSVLPAGLHLAHGRQRNRQPCIDGAVGLEGAAGRLLAALREGG